MGLTEPPTEPPQYRKCTQNANQHQSRAYISRPPYKKNGMKLIVPVNAGPKRHAFNGRGMQCNAMWLDCSGPCLWACRQHEASVEPPVSWPTSPTSGHVFPLAFYNKQFDHLPCLSQLSQDIRSNVGRSASDLALISIPTNWSEFFPLEFHVLTGQARSAPLRV